MRVAIVFIAQKYRDKLLAISQGLQKGIEGLGHKVDIIDGSRDVNTKLSIYEYICVGSESTSIIGGKIPAKVSEYLGQAGMVAGKRSFAFLVRKGFSREKAMRRLMKAMEGEGMYLKFSYELASPEEAEIIGSRLNISRG